MSILSIQYLLKHYATDLLPYVSLLHAYKFCKKLNANGEFRNVEIAYAHMSKLFYEREFL